MIIDRTFRTEIPSVVFEENPSAAGATFCENVADWLCENAKIEAISTCNMRAEKIVILRMTVYCHKKEEA